MPAQRHSIRIPPRPDACLHSLRPRQTRAGSNKPRLELVQIHPCGRTRGHVAHRRPRERYHFSRRQRHRHFRQNADKGIRAIFPHRSRTQRRRRRRHRTCIRQRTRGTPQRTNNPRQPGRQRLNILGAATQTHPRRSGTQRPRIRTAGYGNNGIRPDSSIIAPRHTACALSAPQRPQ